MKSSVNKALAILAFAVVLVVACCSRHHDYTQGQPSFGAAYSTERPRSAKWPAVRAEHLRLHGECIACGSVENLNVHHIVSFSVDPSLELDPGNLCTLCTKNRFGMNDHFIFGHGGNWKCRNPNVVKDSSAFRDMIDGKLCDEPKRQIQTGLKNGKRTIK